MRRATFILLLAAISLQGGPRQRLHWIEKTDAKTSLTARDCARLELWRTADDFKVRTEARQVFADWNCEEILRLTPEALRDAVPARKDYRLIGHRDIAGDFNLVSPALEAQLGSRAANQLPGRIIVDEPKIVSYAQALVGRIAANSDWQGPVYVEVLKNEKVNAMALPGGRVYLTTGLIAFADSEAELAGVIGHELAHIAGRHAVRRISKTILVAQIAEGVARYLMLEDRYGLAAVTTGIAAAVTPMMALKFGRTFEKRTDELGVQYTYAAGCDPRASVDFLEPLAAAEPKRTHTLFASHPPTGKRVKLTEKFIARYLPAREIYELKGSAFAEVRKLCADLHGGADMGSRPKLIRKTQ